MTANLDPAAVARAAGALFFVGGVVELRALGVRNGRGRPHTVSGYFDSTGALASAAASIDGAAKGVYCTLNPVDPALLARCANKAKPYPDATTSDKDIQRRSRLLVDCDPVRDPHISSTDDEHEAAIARAREIGKHFRDGGWPDAALVDSGNGAQLLFALDLPADDGGLVQRVLQALDLQFSDAAVKVDTANYNPARICKLPGTVARKGDDTPERPHRRSALLHCPPDGLAPVPRELLEALAATLPAEEPRRRSTVGSTDFDIERWIADSGLETRGPSPWGQGRKWILSTCPFDSNHSRGEAVIGQHASGAVFFKCHHDGCVGYKWHDLRDLVEPGWQDRRREPITGSPPSEAPDAPSPPPDHAERPDPVRHLVELQPDGLPDAIESALRRFGSELAQLDDISRAVACSKAATVLREAKFRTPGKLVDAATPKRKEEDKPGLSLEAPEPWGEPVDGAALLDGIAATLRRYVVLPDGADVAIALWVLLSHAHDAVDVSPLLCINSPEMRCGKSTALDLIAALVPKPLPTSNISPAALFRSVEKFVPTLLVDEAETFLKTSEEMRGLLNAGHTRTAAFVVRTVGDDHEPHLFSTWCPKVVALIGRLPATLHDRSVLVEMRRRLKGEQVVRLRRDKLAAGALEPLRRKATRWAMDNMDAIRGADPAMPEEISSDRARDNWRPLLAIAGAAGSRWVMAARAAAAAAGKVDEAESLRVELLADLRELFREADKVETKDIIKSLVDRDDRPWAELPGSGRALSPQKVRTLLRPFKVQAAKWRDGARTVRGYRATDFGDAFSRYLGEESASAPPGNPPHPPQDENYGGNGKNNPTQSAMFVADEFPGNGNDARDVADVADAAGGSTEESAPPSQLDLGPGPAPEHDAAADAALLEAVGYLPLVRKQRWATRTLELGRLGVPNREAELQAARELAAEESFRHD